MEDCLKNLFKLSRTTCSCFDADKPVDYNEGQADIYLDELEGFNLKVVTGAADCASGGLWSIMAWARDEAAKRFKADLLACIGQNYESIRPVYSGIIGQTTFTASQNLTGNNAGFNFRSPQIKGGTIKIKRIGLCLNTTAAVQVRVYDNSENQTSPLGSYTINSVANTVAYGILGTPLELPLWSSSVPRLEYYFVYDRGSMQPKDNKGDCGCGGIPPAWKQWIQINGISGSGTNYSGFIKNNLLNGIILDADLKCASSRLICSDEQPLDFDNEGWDMQVVYANRWLAGYFTFQKILDTTEINRYTLMGREKCANMRDYAFKMYSDFIQYLCNNKEVASGCLKCRPNANFKTSNILA